MGAKVMTEQRTLWEYLEQGRSKEEYREQADKQRSRRETIKRLRASGHWLTLLRAPAPSRNRSRLTTFPWPPGRPTRSFSA